MFGPPVPAFGPSKAPILIVAEAPGEEESRRGIPLVGASGQELSRMLAQAGIDPTSVRKTNVFSRQPSGNNLALYGCDLPKAKASGTFRLGPLTTNPVTYLDPSHIHELERLHREIVECEPNVIVALGNTAAWALIGQSGIGGLRGSLYPGHMAGEPIGKVLPTYHPAAILRQWSLRVVTIADLEKARKESLSPVLAYDNSELWIEPTIQDLLHFGRTYMEGSSLLATDVETKQGQITSVGFAPNPGIAINVPFWIDGPEPNYWPTPKDERFAWRWVQRWIEHPAIPKVLQNDLYDTQYFRAMGFKPKGFDEDTMLLHHSKYSELQKGLGFLGSVYTNHRSWKSMRTAKLEELLKKDD